MPINKYNNLTYLNELNFININYLLTLSVMVTPAFHT